MKPADCKCSPLAVLLTLYTEVEGSRKEKTLGDYIKMTPHMRHSWEHHKPAV